MLLTVELFSGGVKLVVLFKRGGGGARVIGGATATGSFCS